MCSVGSFLFRSIFVGDGSLLHACWCMCVCVAHSAALYAPYDPTCLQAMLVASECFMDRLYNLIRDLDKEDYLCFEIITMLPEDVKPRDDCHNLTAIPMHLQPLRHKHYMNLCEAEVTATEYLMMTDAYHQVACHDELMCWLGDYKPVVPFANKRCASFFLWCCCSWSFLVSTSVATMDPTLSTNFISRISCLLL